MPPWSCTQSCTSSVACGPIHALATLDQVGRRRARRWPRRGRRRWRCRGTPPATPSRRRSGASAPGTTTGAARRSSGRRGTRRSSRTPGRWRRSSPRTAAPTAICSSRSTSSSAPAELAEDGRRRQADVVEAHRRRTAARGRVPRAAVDRETGGVGRHEHLGEPVAGAWPPRAGGRPGPRPPPGRGGAGQDDLVRPSPRAVIGVGPGPRRHLVTAEQARAARPPAARPSRPGDTAGRPR